MSEAAVATAEVILREACGDRLRSGFPLAPLTTFRIGGPAALYLEPQSHEDLLAAGRAVGEAGVPFVVMGKGSNVLVSDEGFRGLVLRLGRGFRWAARAEDRLSAGGATPLAALAGVALSHELSGLEFGIAIPGSLGGAVRMNAGAHGRSMAEVVETIETFGLRERRVRIVPTGEMGFAYRSSALPDDAVVIAATMRLHPGASGRIREEMEAAREWRRRTQPLAEPNCGSVFRNPPGGHAGRLIELSGAKGMAVGGASVSHKHANFIVTRQGTRATDVLSLIRRIQAMVEERTGVRLEPEVHLVGTMATVDR